MFITPISNNSTSHIKYPQTSFFGAKTATIKKAQLVTDTFVKAKEPSLKKLKDEFFSLIEKTNIMNTKKRGWKSFFVFEDSPEDQKKLLASIDILIDGPFLMAEKSLEIAFRGSRNQRILDVQKSLAAGTAVETTSKRWSGEY